MKPLSYSQKRLLSLIEALPGQSRSELGKAFFPLMSPYYSLKRMLKMCKRLEARGLIEYDVIREGGRAGVAGVYMVGKPRPSESGYLGIFGRVEP